MNEQTAAPRRETIAAITDIADKLPATNNTNKQHQTEREQGGKPCSRSMAFYTGYSLSMTGTEFAEACTEFLCVVSAG